MDVVGLIANHPRETYTHLDLDGIPFHYLPVTKTTKMEQEAQIWDLIRTSNTDLVVLARYMQILRRTASAPNWQAGASTFITRSCPASRAQNPIIRRMRAA